jgi:hypothetical protein
MKYTHKVKLKDGSYAYRFVAPKDAKLAGVVKNESFRDGRRARHEIPKLVQIVEDFRKGKVLAGNISINSNFKQVVGHYLNTGQFNSLSSVTVNYLVVHLERSHSSTSLLPIAQNYTRDG